MKIHSSVVVWCVGIAFIVFSVSGLTGCGSNSSTSSCDCAICINDEPAYPSDSTASCAAFAVEYGCSSSQLTSDPSDTCGDVAMPHCQVGGCSEQCQCPTDNHAD